MHSFAHAAATALLLVTGAGAQTGPLVTESEFLAPLGADHPAWRAARQELGEAEAAALGARALENPELSATREAPGEAEQIDLTLGWRPPHPTRRRLAIEAAEVSVEAARARLAVQRDSVLQAMREAFAGWATTTAIASRARARAGQLDELARRERRRADAGESSGLDARRLALAAGEAHAGLARAEASRLAAAAAARAWRPDLPAEAVPEVPPLPALGSREAPTHPRLLALRAVLEAARLGERLAARTVEMPAVVGGWQRQDAGTTVAEGPIVGLAWPLPLLDRRRGDRAAARVRVEALEAGLALAERELAAARAGTAAAYTELRAAALAAGRAAADAPAVVDAATRSFAAGESELTDLLDTLRSAADAELAAIELHAEALAAHRRLAMLDLSAPTPEPLTPISTGDSR